MTDQQLLELAAKAAGIEVATAHRHGLFLASAEWWNPLTDDGDALRLAVKLRMIVNTDPTGSQAGDGYRDDACELHRSSDPYAATRRAIVRAAAEIGRSMV